MAKNVCEMATVNFVTVKMEIIANCKLQFRCMYSLDVENETVDSSN